MRWMICYHCQAYQDRKNAPPQPLYSLAAPWPFLAWGMDVIGLVIPKAWNGHKYILVAIDYFTKVGGSRFVQKRHSSSGSPVPET